MTKGRTILAVALAAVAGLVLWAWLARSPTPQAQTSSALGPASGSVNPTATSPSEPARAVRPPQAEASVNALAQAPTGAQHASPAPTSELIARLRNALGNTAVRPESAAEAHAIMRELLARGAEAVPFLAQIASDRSEPALLRQYAVLLLGRIGDVAASSALLAVAQQTAEAEDLRAAAIVALSKLRASDSAAGLRKILETEQPGRISDLCLGALGSHDNQTAVETLYEASQNPEYQTRSMAVISLGDLAANTNHFVQADAALAVANAGLSVVDELAARAPEAAGTPMAQRAIEESQYRWMKETVTALARTDSELAVEILGTVYAFASGQDTRLARDAVAALAGFEGNERAVSVLGAGLRDPNPMVRMVAARSLLVATEGRAAYAVNAAINAESDERVRRDMRTALDESVNVGRP